MTHVSKDDMDFSVLWASARSALRPRDLPDLLARLDSIAVAGGARARALLAAATSPETMGAAVRYARAAELPATDQRDRPTVPGDNNQDQHGDHAAWWAAVVHALGTHPGPQPEATRAARAVAGVQLGQHRFWGPKRRLGPAPNAKPIDFVIRDDAPTCKPIFRGMPRPGDSKKQTNFPISMDKRQTQQKASGPRTHLPSPKATLMTDASLTRKNSLKIRTTPGLLSRKTSLSRKSGIVPGGPGGLSAAATKLLEAKQLKKSIVQTATALVQDPNSHAAKEQEKREREAKKVVQQKEREKAREEEAAARLRKEEEKKAQREADMEDRRQMKEQLAREKERRRTSQIPAKRSRPLSDDDESSTESGRDEYDRQDDHLRDNSTDAPARRATRSAIPSNDRALRKRRLTVEEEDTDGGDSEGSSSSRGQGAAKRQRGSPEKTDDGLYMPENVRMVVGDEINTLQAGDVTKLKIFFEGERTVLFPEGNTDLDMTLNIESKPAEKEGFTRVIESLYLQLSKDGKWKKIRRRKNVRD